MEDSRSKHGRFSWNELLTTDPAAAKEFYTQLFGWTTQAWPMGDFDYTIVKAGEPPAWGAYVTVDDVDATAAKAEKLGAKILLAPTEIQSVGRFTVIQDPQGAVISAITYVKK